MPEEAGTGLHFYGYTIGKVLFGGETRYNAIIGVLKGSDCILSGQHYPPLPDHLRPGLIVLFVGFNPSLRSAETGHHFANPANRFWKIMHQSGLTPRLYRAEEDGDLLELGYGFTNIVARPSRAAADISRDEYRKGAQILTKKIEKNRPERVCFVGKGVYQFYSGRKAVEWGFQEKPIVEGVREFVAPSSSGLVRMDIEQVNDIYRILGNDIPIKS